MARKELAGLAALGALAMMANKSKKSPDVDTSKIDDIDLTGGARAQREADMSNMGDSSNTTGEYAPGPAAAIKPSVASPRMKTPAARPRPRLDTSGVSDMDLTGGARSPSANQDWNKVTPQEAERRKKMESDQALVPIRPEEALVGGGGFSGLKTVAALARGLANRKGAAKLAEYSTPQLGYEPLKLGSEALKLRKKGGAIKMAKGGVTRSSASSRGDGIASKGKTRGKMR
jgi:hypothetical protein